MSLIVGINVYHIEIQWCLLMLIFFGYCRYSPLSIPVFTSSLYEKSYVAYPSISQKYCVSVYLCYLYVCVTYYANNSAVYSQGGGGRGKFGVWSSVVPCAAQKCKWGEGGGGGGGLHTALNNPSVIIKINAGMKEMLEYFLQ